MCGVVDVKVIQLFVKTKRGAPLVPANNLEFTPNGIVGGVPCQPLRQVLFLPKSTLDEFLLAPGDIRENIIVDDPGLHKLPSGSVIFAGPARIRLTFHCEPCHRVSPFVKPKRLLHKRGYLGRFLDSGKVSIGDELTVSVKSDPIPYNIKDRVSWFLEQRSSPILARDLLWEVGLSTTYARSLPNLLRSLSPSVRELVQFESQRGQKTKHET